MDKYAYDQVIKYLNEVVKLSFSKIEELEKSDEIWDVIDEYFIQLVTCCGDDYYELKEHNESSTKKT